MVAAPNAAAASGTTAAASSSSQPGPSRYRPAAARMSTEELRKRREAIRRTLHSLDEAMAQLEKCDAEMGNLLYGSRDSVGGRSQANAPLIARWKQRHRVYLTEVERARKQVVEKRSALIG